MNINNSSSKGIKKIIKSENLNLFRFDTFDISINKLRCILKHNKGLLALDTETTSLTMYDDGNYILGYSLATNDKEGYYFNARCWSKEEHIKFITELNSSKNDKSYWNWSFDYGFSKSHYGVGLDATHDGMLWFHSLFTNRSLETLPNSQEKKGFSLKELTSEFTPFGDYEFDLKDLKKHMVVEINKLITEGEEITLGGLDDFQEILKIKYSSEVECENVLELINKYIRNGENIKEKEFCYGFLPDNILDSYACMDVIATWNLTNRCIIHAEKHYKNGWKKIYDIIELKHKASKIYSDATIRGFKIDRDYVKKLSDEWKTLRELSLYCVKELPEIRKAEKIIFRTALKKEQEKRKPFNEKEFTKDKFKAYFIEELKKAQSKIISKLNLTKCRKIYLKCKESFNNKKQKAIKMSKVSLTKCRNIYNNSVFNLNSSAHKKILFIDLMQLEPLELNKKDSNGNQSPKLNNEFIEHYARLGYDFMEKINTYMLYQKGISSFLGTDESSEKGLWNICSDEHPYNHSNFNITGTISSRLATSNLNLSQFPSRGVLHELKDCFVVEDGYKLFTFDYSTSELRILGALAKENNFLDAFNEGVDLHSKTAYSIWKDKMDINDNEDLYKQIKQKYSETFRYFAKSINFSLPYGTTEFGLSKSIGVSKEEAKQFIDDYRKGNPNIAKFIDSSKDNVMTKGYTEGSYGERLYLKNAKGYDWRIERKKGKNYKAIKEYKKATNFIIQSDNAFMLYKSLISFINEVEELNLGIELIATIYDSMYIRVPKELDNKYVYNLMKKHFEVDFYGIKMCIDIGIALNKDKTYSNRWGHLTDVKFDELDKITEINNI